MRRRPAAVVLPDRNRRTRRQALRRLRVGLLQLRTPYHAEEAERGLEVAAYNAAHATTREEAMRRYSVSSSFSARSYYLEGGKSSIPEHAGTAGAAVAAPAANLRYSVSSIPAPLTPRPTGSGELPHHHPLSPGEASAAEAPPGGSGARSGPRRESAASATWSRGRRCNTAAGRAGGGEDPRPRRPASRGVQ